MTVSDSIELSSTESDALEQLRKRVSHELDTERYDEDSLLYRFLRARDFDLEEAEKSLRNTLQWRKQNRMNSLLTEYKEPEVLKEYMKNFFIGYDKENCEIYYAPLGKYDPKGLHMSAKVDDMEKSVLVYLERAENYIEDQNRKLNNPVGGFLKIIDADGLTFANATDKKALETFIRIIKVIQEHYPERLRCLFIINASSLFTLPYAIFKNFLSPRILNKIRIFGTEGWKEELLKLVDADQLPAFLGGTRTDPDGNPLCKTFVNQGGKVDEKHYIHKSKNSLVNAPGVKKLILPRASFSEIVLNVPEPGSLIEWEFETKTRDIGFGLFFKEKVEGEEEKIAELVALQRMSTDDFAETGMFQCSKAGDYVMLFDNSYSWVRSKEIYYRAKVVSFKEHGSRMEKQNEEGNKH